MIFPDFLLWQDGKKCTGKQTVGERTVAAPLIIVLQRLVQREALPGQDSASINQTHTFTHTRQGS